MEKGLECGKRKSRPRAKSGSGYGPPGTGNCGCHASGSSWSANNLSAGGYVASGARQDLPVNDWM